MSELIAALLALFFLLFLVSLLQPLAARFSLPDSLMLAGLGILLGLLDTSWGAVGTNGVLDDLALGLGALDLNAEAFLYIFLPPLLFTAALGVDLRLLRDESVAVLLLAVVAVVVATTLVGFSLWFVAGVTLIGALLLGAVVAPTDPAAVVGAFRDIGAPRRLATLVNGESLFNDAAAIVLFSLFLVAARGGAAPAPLEALIGFLISFAGGALVGAVAGRLVTSCFYWLRNRPAAATTISVAAAYLVFSISEIYLGVSGVVAVVAAALLVGVEGPARLASAAWDSLRNAWAQLEFWANSLIFVLASMLAVRGLPVARWDDLWLILLLIAASLVARAVILYAVIPLASAAGAIRPIGAKFKTVMLWGGLRGAVTLVLMLSVAGDPSLPEETRRLIALLATAYVFFTIFVQATSLKPLMRLLGLDRLPPLEQQVRDRVLRLSRERARGKIEEAAEAYDIAPELRDQVIAEELAQPEETEMSHGDSLSVGLLTLATREKMLYLNHVQDQSISRRLSATLLASADRLIDQVKDRGIEGWRTQTGGILDATPAERRALFLQRRFGWSRPLERALADRFESLIVTRLVIKELKTYAAGSIAGIMGKQVAKDLQEALDTRLLEVETALAAVETRYPDYAESLLRRYLTRVALRLEEGIYEAHLEETLISREVHADLMRGLLERSEAVNRRPRLALGLELSEMIRRVPIMQDLGREAGVALANSLQPILAMPDQRIVARGQPGREMFFLVAGEVAVRLPRGDIKLGPGSFFGEMALLSNQPRSADVDAVGYCHLLVLKRRDFRRAARRDPALRRHVEEVAAARQAER